MPDIKHFDPDEALERVERLFWRLGAATVSIQAVTAETGLNRSSLYATFGGKRQLYLAALRRYVRERAHPSYERLAVDGRGLPAVQEAFDGLIGQRCSGEYAGWGCMLVNAYASGEAEDPDVRAVLDEHHRRLRDALAGALVTARAEGQLAPGVDLDATAETLVLLAYGVNLRSRAGADAEALRRTVATTLAGLRSPAARGD
ncbi:TetR/AcrR family transcriptional regulator [Streptomyces spectabilis]|uniref:TetR/AcrR family transcriptional regulator n=1 Tax=Streptomyces spectabilis TaxID=68270 RepID=A0A516R9G5_STRST|nr:TetR/AcrR family transcriptional regulator [Streptomyces spectabilis]QDQ12296.1 TetR/AcrR family transcriptional regulator [Streptomyces spectabilis]